MIAKSRIICWLWALVYRRWLDDERVTRVRGWRTARVTNKWGSVKTITPIFWWFD